MSKRFIGYPTGWILGVVDDPDDAERLTADLAASGIGDGDRMVLAGTDDAHRRAVPSRSRM